MHIEKLIKVVYNIHECKKMELFKKYMLFFADEVSLVKYNEKELNLLIEKYFSDIILNSGENELTSFIKEFNSFLKMKLNNRIAVKKEKKIKQPYQECLDVFHIDWDGAEYTLTSIKTGEQISAANKIDKRQLKNAIAKNKIVILKDFNGKLKYRIVKNKIENI